MFVVTVTAVNGYVETRRFARLAEAGEHMTDVLFEMPLAGTSHDAYGDTPADVRITWAPDTADDVLAHVGNGGERAALTQDAPTMAQRGAQP
jgi:hypothetical protein